MKHKHMVTLASGYSELFPYKYKGDMIEAAVLALLLNTLCIMTSCGTWLTL